MLFTGGLICFQNASLSHKLPIEGIYPANTCCPHIASQRLLKYKKAAECMTRVKVNTTSLKKARGDLYSLVEKKLHTNEDFPICQACSVSLLCLIVFFCVYLYLCGCEKMSNSSLHSLLLNLTLLPWSLFCSDIPLESRHRLGALLKRSGNRGLWEAMWASPVLHQHRQEGMGQVDQGGARRAAQTDVWVPAWSFIFT